MTATVTTKQVRTLLDHARDGRCTSDEQRLLAQLLEQAQSTTASLRADLRNARASATGPADAVPCTTCKAPAGRPCTSILPGGHLIAPHTARIWAARKASR